MTEFLYLDALGLSDYLFVKDDLLVQVFLFAWRTQLNKCSDWVMKVKHPDHSGNYESPTNQPTDLPNVRPRDGQMGSYCSFTSNKLVLDAKHLFCDFNVLSISSLDSQYLQKK